MKKLCPPLLLIAGLLFGVTPLAAMDSPLDPKTNGVIEGRVVGADGEELAGIAIFLVDLRRKTESAADGSYRFTEVPAGSFLLEVEGPAGAATRRVEVAPGGVTRQDLELELVHHSDEVVVTGGLLRSQLELAQASTVLHDEDLDFRVQSTLGETLAQQVGISSTSFGAGASRPIVRGLGGDRVRMLQGGIDSGDVSSTSPDHAVSAEPALSERIEVLRGPATLLYGSSAIGGVVNVIDLSIPELRPATPLFGRLELGGNSASQERSGAFAVQGGSGDWAWSAALLDRQADDYEISGGEELPNTDLDTRTGSLGLSRFFGASGYLGLAYSAYDSEYGIPGSEAEGGIRIDLERRRLDLRAEITRELGPFQGLRFRFGNVDYQHAELEGEEREVGTVFHNDASEGRIELVQKPRGGLAGSVGLQVSRRELEAVGEEAFIPPVENQTFALFTFQEIARQEGRLRFQLGARLERQQNDARPAELADRSFTGFSASLGLVYQPGADYALAASLARSAKLPNGEELYASGPHFATETFEVGNPQLDPEHSLGLDLAVRKLSGRVKGELSVFYNRFSDFIYQDFVGEEEDGLPVVLNSQADANFYGAELQGRVLLVDQGDRHLDLIFAADVVRAELDEGGNLPRIPPSRFNLGLHYRVAAWSLFGEVWEVADQERVAAEETPTAGYTQVNAGLEYRLPLGNYLCDFILRGRNLTDETIRNHVSYLKNVAPLPGRDLALSLRFTF